MGSYPSLCVRDPAFVVTYSVGYATERTTAPLFFFADSLTAQDILRWGLHQQNEVVLLRVEAREPVREMLFCADEPADYEAFWDAARAGIGWPIEKSYGCPPKTHVATAIVPRMTVWMGARQGRSDADLLPELESAFDTARKQVPGGEPVVDTTVDIFLPTISA